MSNDLIDILHENTDDAFVDATFFSAPITWY